MATSSSSSSEIGFGSLLLLAFIILKLTGVINWSWWWVLSPLWIGAVIIFVIVVVGIIYMVTRG